MRLILWTLVIFLPISVMASSAKVVERDLKFDPQESEQIYKGMTSISPQPSTEGGKVVLTKDGKGVICQATKAESDEDSALQYSCQSKRHFWVVGSDGSMYTDSRVTVSGRLSFEEIDGKKYPRLYLFHSIRYVGKMHETVGITDTDRSGKLFEGREGQDVRLTGKIKQSGPVFDIFVAEKIEEYRKGN